MSIPPDLYVRAQAFVDRKYTTRADERQRSMGLAYVEAERVDLAKEIARFANDEIERANRERAGVRQPEQLGGMDW